MASKKAEREAVKERIRDKASQRLRSHLKMLKTVQPELDDALVAMGQEISALTAEANHSLKRLDESIASGGETPRKALQRRIRLLSEKQALLAEAAKESPLAFVRAYFRYVKSIVKLSKSQG